MTKFLQNRQKTLLVTVLVFTFLFTGTFAFAALTFTGTSITGDGSVTINGSVAGIQTLFGTQTGGAITIGPVSGGTSVQTNIGAGSGGLNIGATTDARTINFANGAGAQTWNMGNGNAIQTVNLFNHNTPANSITLGGNASSVAIRGAVTTPGTFAIGGGTAISKVVKGTLADGVSGWIPDGATNIFGISASAADVLETSVILVSITDNGLAGFCAVYDQTAGVGFSITCTGNIDDGATLNYVIIN
jgi:hypothetical protein